MDRAAAHTPSEGNVLLVKGGIGLFGPFASGLIRTGGGAAPEESAVVQVSAGSR